MNVLVVSPHPDDAVFGCGAYLASEPGPVVTVFDGAPVEGSLTPYDEACGFESSNGAMATRRLEDMAALAFLGCARHGLGYFDRQYGQSQPRPSTIARQLCDLLRCEGVDGLLAPLGLQHPDHVLASEACLYAASQGVPTWLYEELPYRVLWPELVPTRMRVVRSKGWDLVPDFLGDGGHDDKEKAIDHYGSQKVDLHCCLVPERFWRLVRP